jgi:sulfopyruvate decarboxylase TPP-binding subunit
MTSATGSAAAFAPGTAESLDPRPILREIQEAGITHVITVPDTHQKSLLELMADCTTPQLITVCTEDEAMGVNLGLTMGGLRPMLLIQNSGFYASMNTIRGLSLDGRVPTLMLIGEFFRDPTSAPSTQPSRIVHLLEPTLDLWKIPYYRLDHEPDLVNLSIAFDRAWTDRGPVAVLVGGTTLELS